VHLRPIPKTKARQWKYGHVKHLHGLNKSLFLLHLTPDPMDSAICKNHLSSSEKLRCRFIFQNGPLRIPVCRARSPKAVIPMGISLHGSGDTTPHPWCTMCNKFFSAIHTKMIPVFDRKISYFRHRACIWLSQNPKLQAIRKRLFRDIFSAFVLISNMKIWLVQRGIVCRHRKAYRWGLNSKAHDRQWHTQSIQSRSTVFGWDLKRPIKSKPT